MTKYYEVLVLSLLIIKNLLNNYRSISLICNALSSYYESRDILSPCKSGLNEQDPCVSQLLVITHRNLSKL